MNQPRKERNISVTITDKEYDIANILAKSSSMELIAYVRCLVNIAIEKRNLVRKEYLLLPPESTQITHATTERKVLSIDLTSEQKKQIKILAQLSNLSLSEYVHWLIQIATRERIRLVHSITVSVLT